jgi:hypothetical protein
MRSSAKWLTKKSRRESGTMIMIICGKVIRDYASSNLSSRSLLRISATRSQWLAPSQFGDSCADSESPIPTLSSAYSGWPSTPLQMLKRPRVWTRDEDDSNQIQFGAGGVSGQKI